MSGSSPLVASGGQRDGLKRLAVSANRVEADRARAILLSLSGWKSPAIEVFGVRGDTVRDWRSTFMREGLAGIERHPAPGRAHRDANISVACAVLASARRHKLRRVVVPIVRLAQLNRNIIQRIQIIIAGIGRSESPTNPCPQWFKAVLFLLCFLVLIDHHFGSHSLHPAGYNELDRCSIWRARERRRFCRGGLVPVAAAVMDEED